MDPERRWSAGKPISTGYGGDSPGAPRAPMDNHTPRAPSGSPDNRGGDDPHAAADRQAGIGSPVGAVSAGNIGPVNNPEGSVRSAFISTHASPISRSLSLVSFCKQRCSNDRTESGVAVGRAPQSGSCSMMVASRVGDRLAGCRR